MFITHTIAPGIEIVAHNDDLDTNELLNFILERADRQSNIETIECAVRAIAEIDDEDYQVEALGNLIEAAGYSSVRSFVSGAEFAATILALVPVLGIGRLIRVAEEADREIAKIHGIESVDKDDEGESNAEAAS